MEKMQSVKPTVKEEFDYETEESEFEYGYDAMQHLAKLIQKEREEIEATKKND